MRRHVSLLLQVHYQKIGIARPRNNHVGASYYIVTVNMFQTLIFSPINQQSSEAHLVPNAHLSTTFVHHYFVLSTYFQSQTHICPPLLVNEPIPK